MKANDVAWHAGNWYVNMHSIGIEHEGFAPQGATWFTEALYRNSAKLVSYLAAKNNIPLDRAHIIGHDQVPGTVPSTVAGMHWDPGPYWDWEHYFDLLGAPIYGHSVFPVKAGSIVTIKPGFEGNVQVVSNCDAPGTPCTPQATNFVYLRQSPDDNAPLVKDIGLHPSGIDGPLTSPTWAHGPPPDRSTSWRNGRATGSRSGTSGRSGWFKSPASAPDAFAQAGSRGEAEGGHGLGAGVRTCVPGAGGVPGGYPVPDGHAAAVHDRRRPGLPGG